MEKPGQQGSSASISCHTGLSFALGLLTTQRQLLPDAQVLPASSLPSGEFEEGFSQEEQLGDSSLSCSARHCCKGLRGLKWEVSLLPVFLFLSLRAPLRESIYASPNTTCLQRHHFHQEGSGTSPRQCFPIWIRTKPLVSQSEVPRAGLELIASLMSRLGPTEITLDTAYKTGEWSMSMWERQMTQTHEHLIQDSTRRAIRKHWKILSSWVTWSDLYCKWLLQLLCGHRWGRRQP